MSIVIRPADPDDAAGACEVVCNSIVHACTRDHLRDPQRLLRWLQNKTVDNFAAWLRAPANSGFIALIDGRVVGIALIDTDGDIRLCYVRAERLGQGIGSGLLDAMIARARAQGLARIHTHSTLSAKGFYQRRGFVAAGAPLAEDGMTAYPLALSLGAPLF